jgi:hypothetical protein
MKKLWVVSLLIFSLRLFGQESSIYRKDGKLRIDTLYSINPDRINDFLQIEKYILPDIYNNLEYPYSSSKCDIEGLVIAKITIDDTILVKLVKTVHETISKSVLHTLDTAFIRSELLRFNDELINIRTPFVFYLPIKFEVLHDTFLEDLKQSNSLVIRASSGTKYYEKK